MKRVSLVEQIQKELSDYFGEKKYKEGLKEIYIINKVKQNANVLDEVLGRMYAIMQIEKKMCACSFRSNRGRWCNDLDEEGQCKVKLCLCYCLKKSNISPSQRREILLRKVILQDLED